MSDNFDDRLDKALQSNKDTAHLSKNHDAQIIEQSAESKKATGRAFRMGVEIFSALVVGCGMGLLIDHYFDTKPFGLIIFFFLGCGAGFMNVFRAMKGMGYKVGYDKNEIKNDTDSNIDHKN